LGGEKELRTLNLYFVVLFLGRKMFVASFLKHKETAIKQRRWDELMACSCSKS